MINKKIHKLRTITIILILGMLSHCVMADDHQKSLHDPTQPPAMENILATDKIIADTTVSAIFSGKATKTAIINGETFRVGDKMGDTTIIAIDINGVTVKDIKGEISKISLSEPHVKTPTIKREVKP